MGYCPSNRHTLIIQHTDTETTVEMCLVKNKGCINIIAIVAYTLVYFTVRGELYHPCLLVPRGDEMHWHLLAPFHQSF